MRWSVFAALLLSFPAGVVIAPATAFAQVFDDAVELYDREDAWEESFDDEYYGALGESDYYHPRYARGVYGRDAYLDPDDNGYAMENDYYDAELYDFDEYYTDDYVIDEDDYYYGYDDDQQRFDEDYTPYDSYFSNDWYYERRSR